MKYIAVTPSNGTLIHALDVSGGEPSKIDGHYIAKAACGLRRGIGFDPAGGEVKDFHEAAGNAPCLRCVKAVSLSDANSEEERALIERSYRDGTLRLAAA